MRSKAIINCINSNSETRQMIMYTLIILVNNASLIIVSFFKTSLISKTLGTIMLDAYVVTSNIISYVSYVLFVYNNGIIAQISQHIAKSEFSLVGKRINISEVVGIISSGLIALSLWLCRDIFLMLYQPAPEVVDNILPFYNLYLLTVPVLMFSSINSSILIGLHALYFRMFVEFLAQVIDIGSLYLFMLYFDLGLNSVIYSTLLGRLTAELLHFLYIYQPAHINQYFLFSRVGWNFMEKSFRSGFAIDSVFLIGRGFLIMSQYVISPIIVSRLGTYELAAYTIMNTLWLLPTIISDSLGYACNMKGSEYIGLKKYSYYRNLVIYAPIVSLFIGLFFACIYYFGKSIIFAAFTSDPLVLWRIEESFPFWLFVVVVGSFPGAFEGLAMAKQYFFMLFFVMLFALIFCEVIGGLNLFWLRELPLVWAALAVFMWTRFFPLVGILYWEAYKERNWEDGDDKEDSSERNPSEVTGLIQ